MCPSLAVAPAAVAYQLVVFQCVCVCVPVCFVVRDAYTHTHTHTLNTVAWAVRVAHIALHSYHQQTPDPCLDRFKHQTP